MLFKPRKLKPGDELTTYWLNRVLTWCQTNTINLGPNSGLSMIQSPLTGTQLRVIRSGSAQLAVTTSGGVTACVANAGSCTNSGTLLKWTPGTGFVYYVSYNGTCLVADTSSTSVAVRNFSTTTGGILGNVLVWTQLNSDGQRYVTAVDCGN